MEKNDLLNALANGEFDSDLDRIIEMVKVRRAVNAPQIWEFLEGQRVRINSKANPKYLRGVEATIRQVNRTRVVLDFDKPQGRFYRGVTTPLALIEKL